MGFFANLRNGIHIGRKAKKGSPSLSLLEEKKRQQYDEAPIVAILGPPVSPQEQASIQPPLVIDVSPTSTPHQVKRRPAPLSISAREPSYTNVAVQSESPQVTPLHRTDSLVSSSLATPHTPGIRSLRQMQDRLDFEARLEELSFSTAGQAAHSAIDDSAPSETPKEGSSRLFRKASEKVMEFALLRSASRNGSNEMIGRSLPGGGSMSVASLASTHSPVLRQGSTELHHTKSYSQDRPPSLKAIWRRSRALSNASSKDVKLPLPLSSSASFARPSTRSSGREAEVDLPSTLQAINKPLPPSPSMSNEEVAVPYRWRKLSKKSLRPSTSNSVIADSAQIYMLRLSPPPRGLASEEMDGRKNLVCHYVQEKLSEEVRKTAKASIKRPLTASSPIPSTMSAEGFIEKLEDDFHQFMIKDIKDDTDAQDYKVLHLADVFIEARRSLGVQSMCLRLHAMFDIAQTQLPTLEARGDARELEPPSISPPPPSAWETNPRKFTSLAPAPRRRRRPKTTPDEYSSSVDDLHHGGTISPPSVNHNFSAEPDLDSFASLDSSLDSSINDHTAEDSKYSALQHPSIYTTPTYKSPSVAFPTMHHSASLPPSPPKSIDSHHLVEVVSKRPSDSPLLSHLQGTTPHTRILSEVLAL